MASAPFPGEPIRTVAAVIADDSGHVLLVRKRGSATFIQPGGKAEAAESPLATLARELREELGVGFDPGSVVDLGTFEDRAVHEPGRRVRARLFSVSIDGAPSPGAEIEALAWIDPRNADPGTVAPLSRRHILPAFLRRREVLA